MENKEPLLKDEVETFPFLQEDKPKKENNQNKVSLIVTIVLSIIILAFVGKMFYAFYIGFKYYNLRFEDTTSENRKENVIDLTSAILNDTYKKIKVTNANELSNLFSTFYGENEVKSESINNNDRLAIIFSYLNIGCNSLTSTKTKAALKEIAVNLFNDERVVDVLNDTDIEIGNYKVTFNAATNDYTITLNACTPTNDFVVKKIEKATTEDDNLYIYEKFGYFVSNGINTYDVYGKGSKGNVLTTFTDSLGNKEFNNVNVLKTYKWTFKKGSGNNYYFVSINPIQ